MSPRGLPPIPKVVSPNGRRPCRGCGGEVPKGRSIWCGNDCRDAHYMALSTFARRRVHQRDHGVCERCGADADKAERILCSLHRHGDYHKHAGFELLCGAWGVRVSSWGWHIPTLWEADHRVPLVEGGTNTIDNYRTLCVPCHRAETKLLAQRRSKRGRQAALVLAFLLLATPALADQRVTFTLPEFSARSATDCTPVVGIRADTKRVSIYGRRASSQLWVQLWGVRYPRAGMKDGLPVSFSLPPSIYAPGESVVVWIQLSDSSGNWQKDCPSMRKAWRVPQ